MKIPIINNHKGLKIRSNILIFLIINICLVAIIEIFKMIAVNSNIELRNQYKIMFIIALLTYLYVILSAYHSQKRIDPYIIFISISFFFFYGQQALVFFNVQRDDITILQEKIQSYYLIKTGYVILQCILCTYIGYIISHGNKNYTKVEDNYNSLLEGRSLFKTAFVFFLISIIPTLLYLYNNIKITLTKGYGYRIIENSNQITSSRDIFLLLSGFMLPSLIAMYISCKKKDEKKTMLIIVLYLILYTLSGSRINAFCSLCIISYILISKKNKYIKKSIYKYLMTILLIIFVFTIISDVRSSISSNGILNQLSISVNNIWNNNFIFSAFRETGYTFAVTACIFQYSPSPIAHINGMSYISSIVYILPNFLTNNFIGNYQFVDEAFSQFLSSYGGIGSSFIAEAYYNFSNLTFIFMVIVGILWGKLTNKIEMSLSSNRKITYFSYIYLFQLFIFSVRSDMVYNFRVFVWYILPISIISNILYKRKINSYGKFNSNYLDNSK